MSTIMGHLVRFIANQETINMGTIRVTRMEIGFAYLDGVDHTVISVSHLILQSIYHFQVLLFWDNYSMGAEG